jgi:uncharacterized membrane protein
MLLAFQQIRRLEMSIVEWVLVIVAGIVGAVVGYALDPEISNVVLGVFAGFGILAVSLALADTANEALRDHYAPKR